MYSTLICETKEIATPESYIDKEDSFGVKLYLIELSKYKDLVSNSVSILSQTERNRAERYHFKKDRNRFIICRILLKFLLAKHIRLDIKELQLDIDSNKKPFLSSYPSVFFNLTHSGDYAMIVIGDHPIGVDIEYINKDFNYEEILSNVFSISEIDEIINSEDKHLSFYKFWTRKEAIVKAIGKGIDDDLPRITATDGKHSITQDLLGNFERMTVYNFRINEDYMGALAFTDHKYDLKRIGFNHLPTSEELIASVT